VLPRLLLVCLLSACAGGGAGGRAGEPRGSDGQWEQVKGRYGRPVLVAGRGATDTGGNEWQISFEGGPAVEAELSRPHFAMADAAGNTKDPDALTEAVRGSLGRAICRQYQTDQGELPAIGLAPALEQRLMGAMVRTEQGAVLALDPADAQNLASRIARALETAVAQPVLLCSPALRPHLWRLFSRVLPHLGVLSHNEVPAHVRLTPVAVID